jgi:hypothetical protein
MSLKKFLFAGIVIPTLLTSFYLAGSTIYLNIVSSSGGPVHWHADFQIWDCGKEVELEDPTGFLSNKVGTATLHEHNDQRIHLEGVVVKEAEASLGHFFDVVGGKISANEIQVPTNNGLIIRRNGDGCGDGKSGILQVYLFRTSGDTYTQEKVANPEKIILSPHGAVPPGDCIIMQFKSTVEDKTDKICQQYRIKEQLGELHGN